MAPYRPVLAACVVSVAFGFSPSIRKVRASNGAYEVTLGLFHESAVAAFPCHLMLIAVAVPPPLTRSYSRLFCVMPVLRPALEYTAFELLTRCLNYCFHHLQA